MKASLAAGLYTAEGSHRLRDQDDLLLGTSALSKGALLPIDSRLQVAREIWGATHDSLASSRSVQVDGVATSS